MAESDDEVGLVDVKMEDGGGAGEDFTFQDFTKGDDINNLNTVGNIGEEPGRTIPANLKTQSLEDFSDDDEEDKTELLAGQRKQPPFWTFEYYQTFFDVDTYQVLRRIIGSMVPVYKKNYLVSFIRPNPDLYGPFWVCATLVFTTAISGNLASYLINSGDHEWVYDFHKVTLAAAAIYTYAFLVPTALWGVLLWRRSNAGYSFLEILCVYGYSLSIYVPISVLWVVPLEWLRWLLVMIAMILSGAVLLLTFWPAVEDDDKKVAGILLAVIFLLHGLLAVGFKLYFFHAPPEPAPQVTPTPANRTTT
ncbi:protein YIPF1 [Pocillopora verrucosa]|uniref:protein YIPF1 n=1 Tax=Pocillopora verrucosa TaxID=203993 RepID=UPI002797C447|nr:protein YIPF1-like [Pocillopora verrucosa]XP_058951971.1 protein YIPF1-like [Pocillopora verrucosa]